MFALFSCRFHPFGSQPNQSGVSAEASPFLAIIAERPGNLDASKGCPASFGGAGKGLVEPRSVIHYSKILWLHHAYLLQNIEEPVLGRLRIVHYERLINCFR